MFKKKKDDEKLYQVPIDALSLNVVVYRKQGDDFIFIDFNKAAEITENINKESILGKRLTEVFPAVKEFGLFEILQRIDKDGGHETFDLKFYEDERISGWRKNEVIKLPNGDIMAIYEDLTKEKQLEEKLKKIQFLGLILDNSINEVYMFTKDTFRFTYINRGARENIGYSLEEMLEMTPMDIKPNYTKYQFKNLLIPLLDGSKKEMILDTLHTRKDGTTYNVEAHVQLMNIDDSEQFVVIALDITKRKKIELELKQSEEQFRAIAESSLMGIFIYRDKLIYVNKALSEMIGYSNKELLNMSPWELMDDSLKEQTKDLMSKRLTGKHFAHKYDDLMIKIKSGGFKTARIMTETIKYKDGYAGLGTVMDITDIKNTKQKLKMLAQALEQTDELVMITDSQGIITYVNDAYVAHSGYKQYELIGKNSSIFKSGIHNNEFFENLWQTISGGKTYMNTIVSRKKDKQLYHEEVTISPIYDDKGTIKNYISTGRDITPRIKMEEELLLRATTDELTKIYNRYYGNEILDVEVDRADRYGSSFAVLMFDIDHFKKVNDTYGHNVGDDVLRKLSEVISIHLRKSDTFIRWGGEEFLIISVHIDESEAMKFAQKLRLSIASYEFNSHLNITISVGVTISKVGDTKESILKRADDALYQAKEDDRNCIKFV